MCSKAFLTVLVPAPDEPVTAMMGCFLDMVFSLLLVEDGSVFQPKFNHI